MGGNLAKTPLTAIIFAAILTFCTALVPATPGYKEALVGFEMPLLGYLIQLAIGFLLSVIIVLVFFNARAKGPGFWLMLCSSVVGFMWIMPFVSNFLFKQPTGALAAADYFFAQLAGVVATVLLIITIALVIKPAQTKTDPNTVKTHKFNIMSLVIKMIVLVIVFMGLFFVVGYFLAWRSEAFRNFYSQGAQDTGFVLTMIDMLVYNSILLPSSLLVGFLYLVFSFPLLTLLPHKRALFIALNTILYIAASLNMLVPNLMMAENVAATHLPGYLVIFGVYGVFSGFLLHTSLKSIVDKKAAIQQPARSATAGQPRQADSPRR